MAAEAPAMHCAPQAICSYCMTAFTPKRRWAAFCSDRCRSSYDEDIGIEGRVRRVSKIKRGGVAVTIHLTGPAAERALHLGIYDYVRVVRKP